MILPRLCAVIAAAASLGASFGADALGTPAGTNIQNAAQVTYTVSGVSTTSSSNTTSVVVVEILDAVVTIASATVGATPGATQQELVFTLTNTGNGTETFNLAALSAGVAGDNFDPVLSTPAIYFDTDGSGDLSAPDIAYVAGSNDPVLAADAPVRVLVVNNIPAGLADGDRGRSELTARALTGTGAPGTVFTNGGVDAVAGTTGGGDVLFGEYVIAGLQLTAVKSQTIIDQFGGARALPGARINYQVVVTASGSGTATAATFADPIPTSTTYVAGSLELNNAALTDSGDADAGEFATTPAPEVRVSLGDLSSASGPQTIEFAVTIN
ncbi:MAG: hypothetical protein ACREV5_14995 [Steroidobacter sp.]